MNRALALIVVLGLSSCVYHKGMMTGTVPPGSKNYEVVRYATGTSTVIRLLGLGGAKREGMINAARRDMVTNFPLEDGQVYASITVDIQNGFFLLFTKSRVIVSSEIIQESGKISISGSIIDKKRLVKGNVIISRIAKRDQAFIVSQVLENGLISAFNSSTNFILIDPKDIVDVFSVGDLVSLTLRGGVEEKGMITKLHESSAVVTLLSSGSRVYKKYLELTHVSK